jgi:hypothetical protein
MTDQAGSFSDQTTDHRQQTTDRGVEGQQMEAEKR